MGWKWEVSAWVEVNGRYDWSEVYTGQSWLKAVRAARKAKRAGAGCVRVKWR